MYNSTTQWSLEINKLIKHIIHTYQSRYEKRSKFPLHRLVKRCAFKCYCQWHTLPIFFDSQKVKNHKDKLIFFKLKNVFVNESIRTHFILQKVFGNRRPRNRYPIQSIPFLMLSKMKSSCKWEIHKYLWNNFSVQWCENLVEKYVKTLSHSLFLRDFQCPFVGMGWDEGCLEKCFVFFGLSNHNLVPFNWQFLKCRDQKYSRKISN